jgi:hypothetical protein
MITGEKAFRRESRAATRSAILHEDPKLLHELAPGAPPKVEKLVARCLRKDRERRLRSMADLSLALRELQDESASILRGLQKNAALGFPLLYTRAAVDKAKAACED